MLWNWLAFSNTKFSASSTAHRRTITFPASTDEMYEIEVCFRVSQHLGSTSIAYLLAVSE